MHSSQAYASKSVISEIRIQNFKSVNDLTLKTGRVTVLIGENGSGKSNILEGIAFAAGAVANKLDNEFLFNRGIRVTEETWMKSAFPREEVRDANAIRLAFKEDKSLRVFECEVTANERQEDGSFDGWRTTIPVDESEFEVALDFVRVSNKTNFDDSIRELVQRELAESLAEALKRRFFASEVGFGDFVIYAPENTVLRTPPPEGAIQPLGTKGEGLLKLLQSFSDPKFSDRLTDMKERLRLFGWFNDFIAPDDVAAAAARLQIRDKWLAEDRAIFDQRSANEGFLYVLFYLTLLMSWRTPKFFAVDNIDNALNPKLCSALMQQIVELAKKYDKQVICTTHNPAILDGLDLHDDAQRLYAVSRNSDGHTVVHRVRAPKPQPGETPIRLSEAFVRGIIGGLPDHF